MEIAGRGGDEQTEAHFKATLDSPLLQRQFYSVCGFDGVA
jgi:hypothetical protein